MKLAIPVISCLFAMAACSNPAPTAAVEDLSPSAEVATEPCPEQAGYIAFPEGVALDIPYHLRADRIYIHKNGKERRRVSVEFLDGDAGTALASFEQSMIRAGFTAKPRKDMPNGNVTMAFGKKGFGTVRLVAVSTPGPKPSNPGAKGVISMDYPADNVTAAPSRG